MFVARAIPFCYKERGLEGICGKKDPLCYKGIQSVFCKIDSHNYKLQGEENRRCKGVSNVV